MVVGEGGGRAALTSSQGNIYRPFRHPWNSRPFSWWFGGRMLPRSSSATWNQNSPLFIFLVVCIRGRGSWKSFVFEQGGGKQVPVGRHGHATQSLRLQLHGRGHARRAWVRFREGAEGTGQEDADESGRGGLGRKGNRRSDRQDVERLGPRPDAVVTQVLRASGARRKACAGCGSRSAGRPSTREEVRWWQYYLVRGQGGTWQMI